METESPADHVNLNRLLGSWALLSYEHVLPSGETLHPFGDHPSGMLVYQADGSMSVHISVENPARLIGEDFREAGDEDAVAAWRSYFGYWGTFKSHADRRIVVHRVEGSSFANWIGTEQVRHFRFDANGHLLLETEFANGRYTLTWERKSA
jgi:hypothetical protein